jgi:hypothetical protein
VKITSVAVILPIGENAKKESELLEKTIREYFVEKYRAWDDIFILYEGAATKRFKELFGLSDNIFPTYSFVSGEKIAKEMRFNKKLMEELESKIRKELKLSMQTKISQIYLLDAKIEEGPSLAEPYFNLEHGKIIEMKHYGYELASLYWIKFLDRESQEDFIQYIFGIHEPGHIHVGRAPHFINTPYGQHCRDENCIMSTPERTMEDSVEKVRRIKLQNPELFCKKCSEKILELL